MLLRIADPAPGLAHAIVYGDDGWATIQACVYGDDAAAVAARIRDEVYDAPHGDPLELFAHVYVDPPAHLAEQRELLRRELEGPGA